MGRDFEEMFQWLVEFLREGGSLIGNADGPYAYQLLDPNDDVVGEAHTGEAAVNAAMDDEGV